MNTGRGVSLTLALLAALGLMHCNQARSSAPPPVTHTVTIEGMQFTPANLTVEAGDTIVWVNKDLFPHTVTAAGAFDSKSIADGQSWQYRATSKGEYPYTCTFHPTMKGTVRVE